jgi:hypothetical protein
MHPVTLNFLTAFPDQLEAAYAAIPSNLKHWAPSSWDGVPSEALTAIEQVCHVRDIEIDGYHVRFRRTLEESNPTLASLDTEALAVERKYGSADAQQVFSTFRAARAQTVQLLGSLSAEQLLRTAYFEGYGPVSLRSLIHFLSSHDQQHLAGLQWLLGKMHSSVLRARPEPSLERTHSSTSGGTDFTDPRRTQAWNIDT